MKRSLVVALRLSFALAMLPGFCLAKAQSESGSIPSYDCGGVGGTIRAQSTQIPQRGGGTLEAKILAPDATRQTAPCPLISVLPGGGAGINSVEWAAERLAASGYIVVITKPQFGVSLDSYNAAVRSGIDFMLSGANPYLRDTKTDAVGVAGWSLGARVLARTQEEDARVRAVVAWDNMAVSETGDAGSPACTNAPGTLRTPRVPTMGQASETCADGRSGDAKKTAYNRWRESGVPAMEVVFAGSTHFNWSASASTMQHDLSHYYTLNWFDRWLKNDTSARLRLLARTINNVSVGNLLSPIFKSGCILTLTTAAILRKVTPPRRSLCSRRKIQLAPSLSIR